MHDIEKTMLNKLFLTSNLNIVVPINIEDRKNTDLTGLILSLKHNDLFYIDNTGLYIYNSILDQCKKVVPDIAHNSYIFKTEIYHSIDKNKMVNPSNKAELIEKYFMHATNKKNIENIKFVFNTITNNLIVYACNKYEHALYMYDIKMQKLFVVKNYYLLHHQVIEYDKSYEDVTHYSVTEDYYYKYNDATKDFILNAFLMKNEYIIYKPVYTNIFNNNKAGNYFVLYTKDKNLHFFNLYRLKNKKINIEYTEIIDAHTKYIYKKNQKPKVIRAFKDRNIPLVVIA